MADFDWGNLLYIGIMIAFAILGSKKKRKPATTRVPYQSSPEPEVESSPGFFEQVFGDDFRSQFSGENKSVTKPVFEHIYNEKSNNDFVDKSSPEPDVKENETIYKAVQDRQLDNNVPQYPETFELYDNLNDFSFRKAIIYSEILSRKEY